LFDGEFWQSQNIAAAITIAIRGDLVNRRDDMFLITGKCGTLI